MKGRLRGRRLALAAVVAALGAGLLSPAVRAQPPVDPEGSATRWSFDYVQAAVESLVSEPLPAAFGGVTIRDYFYNLGLRLWGAIALIMVVVQGLKVAMGSRLDMWGLVTFLLWIAFPLMVLEGFYTPYALFGNQTFIELVVGQGQALAAAMNGAGGAFARMHDLVYSTLANVYRQLGIAFTAMPGGMLAVGRLAAAVFAISQAAGVVIVSVLILLIATLLVYTQVVWANVAIGILTLLGPVFVPFLLVEQLSFLFWSWVKGLVQYSFQVVVAALILRMIAELAAYPLEGINEFVESLATVGVEGGEEAFTQSFVEVIKRTGTWVPVILAALLISFKVGEVTQVMIGGSQNLSSGLTAVAAGAAATVAKGAAAVGGGLASAGLSMAARGAASAGMKGTAGALARGAQAAGRMSRGDGGEK